MFFRTQYNQPKEKGKNKGENRGKGKGKSSRRESLTITLENNKRSFDDSEQGDSDEESLQESAAIKNKDGGLFGRRKPVFVRKPMGKANPPLDNIELASCARFRYDLDRLE